MQTSAEETETRPVIVSGSIHSVASPPRSHSSPVHSHSPLVRSVGESNGELSARGSSQLHDDSAALDDGCIKVSVFLMTFSIICTSQ